MIKLPSGSINRQQSYITKVYAWLTLGLSVSGITAVYVSHNVSLAHYIIGNRIIFYVLLLLQLFLVVIISSLVSRFSVLVDATMFWFYSVVSGMTLSIIFFVYSINSIIMTFLITAGTFGLMSLYGYLTKKDLSRLGSFLVMALLGLIIVQFINLFNRNTSFNVIIASVGVLIFVGLTAYDTQKIKNLNTTPNSSELIEKEAISGALTLYLDFINLFLDLLRLLGRRD